MSALNTGAVPLDGIEVYIKQMRDNYAAFERAWIMKDWAACSTALVSMRIDALNVVRDLPQKPADDSGDTIQSILNF